MIAGAGFLYLRGQILHNWTKAVFDLGIYDDMVDIDGVARVINDLT